MKKNNTKDIAKKLILKKYIWIIGGLFVIVSLFVGGIILFFFLIISDDESTEGEMGFGGEAILNAEMEKFRPLFEKYAKLYGISDQVELLMAMGMQESGGAVLDVMQSSESIGLPPNSIIRPEKSIDVGVKYFSEMLKQADGDEKTAIQSYNFGGGFIGYVKKNGGKYSKDIAKDFAIMMAQKMGWSSYGDINYVDNVMRYYSGINQSPEFDKSSDWQFPVKRVLINSGFGSRILLGSKDFHSGLDFDCNAPESIHAVADGIVDLSVNFNPSYGNYIRIKHGNGEYSLYAHMSKLNVKEGQQVRVGQQIGVCGTTGHSTGEHLHLEHQKGSDFKKLDPAFMFKGLEVNK